MFFKSSLRIGNIPFVKQKKNMNMNDKNFIDINSIGHSILILDPNYNIIGVNHATEKLVGRSENELIGKKCFELFHGTNNQTLDCPLAKTKISNQIETEEIIVETSKGKFLVTCTPQFDNNHQLEKIIHIAVDVTSIRSSEEKTKMQLSEKELMIREIHHRVKNNLNAIAGIMWLQMSNSQEPMAITALSEARNRVLSMMLLYDKLYCSCDFKNISLKDYLASLIDETIKNFPTKATINVTKNIDDLSLHTDKLSTIGIIVNELLTNIMKHAFKDRENGQIDVSSIVNNNDITIAVSDNGITIPETIDFHNTYGFGLRLVHMLVRQLAGTIKIERNKGSKFIFEFDISKNN